MENQGLEVLAVWSALMAIAAILPFAMMRFTHWEPRPAAALTEPPVWSVEGLALALARGEITAEIFTKFSELIAPTPNRDKRLATALVNLNQSKRPARRSIGSALVLPDYNNQPVPPARPARQSFRRWFRNLDAGNLLGTFGALYLVVVTLTDTMPGQIMRITLGAMAYWSGLIDQTQALEFAQWSVKIAL
jgi:hypothetical protein